jgi:hypothetical protein
MDLRTIKNRQGQLWKCVDTQKEEEIMSVTKNVTGELRKLHNKDLNNMYC